MENKDILSKIYKNKNLLITILFFTIFYFLAVAPIITRVFCIKNELSSYKGRISTDQLTYLTHQNNYAEIILPENTYNLKTTKKIKSVKDPRILALKRYLEYRGSPMAPYAEIFVKEADKYGLNWKILVAISGVESNFGTITPYQSHNAWGWKGGPYGSFSKFSNWEEAIKYMSHSFSRGYGKNPNPYDIESTYCPPCGQAGTHAWARGVNRFMKEIQYFYDEIVKADPVLRKAK